MDRKVEISKEEIRGSKRSMHDNVLTTNDWVRSKINFLVGPQEVLLASVKRGKLAWFGHVTRHDSPSKTSFQGTLEGGRRRGRQRKRWMDNIKEWTYLPMAELLDRVSCRKGWKGYLLNRPSCPTDHPFGHLECELNCILKF